MLREIVSRTGGWQLAAPKCSKYVCHISWLVLCTQFVTLCLSGLPTRTVQNHSQLLTEYTGSANYSHLMRNNPYPVRQHFVRKLTNASARQNLPAKSGDPRGLKRPTFTLLTNTFHLTRQVLET